MGMRKPGPPLHQRGFKLTPRQIEWLGVRSEERGVSSSEVMRGILDDYIDRYERLIPRTRRKPLKTAEKRQMLLDKIAA
jgi:hypothetical protein